MIYYYDMLYYASNEKNLFKTKYWAPGNLFIFNVAQVIYYLRY